VSDQLNASISKQLRALARVWEGHVAQHADPQNDPFARAIRTCAEQLRGTITNIEREMEEYQ
jgi:hypothetical protein